MKRKIKGGDCYYIAGQFAMDNVFSPKKIDYKGTPYLVHAEVQGQGKVSNLRYGHAWIEDDENVYDFSNGRELIIPKVLYYAIGDIRTNNPKKYQKYTFSEARKRMLQYKHYGCWDLDVEYKEGGNVISSPDIRYEIGGIFQGTPHEFDKYSTDYMGTGEGQQVFGWGLYFTDIKDIAKQYAKNELLIEKEIAKKSNDSAHLWIYSNVPSQVKDKLVYLKNELNDLEEKQSQYPKLDLADKIKTYRDLIDIIENYKGKVYSVTLFKGENESDYDLLLWDSPVNIEQLEKIFIEAEKIGGIPLKEGWYFSTTKQDELTPELLKAGYSTVNLYNERSSLVRGHSLYNHLSNELGSDKEASLFLLRAGIDGIKYKSGFLSGMADKEGYNYVIFDADDATIENKELYKNGGLTMKKPNIRLDKIEVKIIEDDSLAEKVYNIIEDDLSVAVPRLALIENDKVIGGIYLEPANSYVLDGKRTVEPLSEYKFDIYIKISKRKKGYSKLLLDAMIKDFIYNFPDAEQIRGEVINKKLEKSLQKNYGFNCDSGNQEEITYCYLSRESAIKYLKRRKLSNGGTLLEIKPKEKKDIICSSCGWSWNKHQSEEHDVYVCHKCGTDNSPAHQVTIKEENFGFFKIYLGEKEVGYISYDFDKGLLEIISFFIKSEYRNKGIGTIARKKIVELLKPKEIRGSAVSKQSFKAVIKAFEKPYYMGSVYKQYDDIDDAMNYLPNYANVDEIEEEIRAGESDGIYYTIKLADGGSIPDLLSSQQVENKLGRELHWWNDDIVYLSGIKYKKVYLRPEYKVI
jgi:hypothetical protein